MCKLDFIKKLIEQLEGMSYSEEFRSVMSIDGRYLSVKCFCKGWMMSLVGVLDSVKDCTVYINSNTDFQVLYHGE